MNHNNGRWIFIPMQIKILVQTYTLVRTKAQKDKYRFLPSSTLCPVIADDSIWQKVHRWYHSHILHKCVSDTQAKNHIFNSPCCLFLASLAKCTLGKDANLHTKWRCIKAKIKKCKNANLALLAKMKDCVFSISFIWHTSVHGVGLLQCTKIFGSRHPCHRMTQCDTVWQNCHTRLLSQLFAPVERWMVENFPLLLVSLCLAEKLAEDLLKSGSEFSGNELLWFSDI